MRNNRDNITKPMKKIVKKDWILRQACSNYKCLPERLTSDMLEELDDLRLDLLDGEVELDVAIDHTVDILGSKNVTTLLYSKEGLLKERSNQQERKEKLEACDMGKAVSKDLFEKIVWLNDVSFIKEMMYHGLSLPLFNEIIIAYAIRNEVVEEPYELFHLLATVGLERFGGKERLKKALLTGIRCINNSRATGLYGCLVMCYGVEFSLKDVATLNRKEEAIMRVYNEID